MRARITGPFSTAYASFKQDCPALLRAIAAFAVLCWVILVVAMLAGCSATSRTKVDGAATEASHRVEQPGVTRTKTTKLRIGEPAKTGGGTPPAPSTDPLRRASPATSPVGDGGGSWTPAAPAMQSVAWAKPKADPVAEAIREAAANGVPVEYEFTESESVPLGVTESTLSDRGASLVTSSDEAAIGFEGSKSGASLPWGKRSGDSSFGLTADLTRVPTSPLVWLGGFLVIAGGVVALIPPRRLGVAAGIAGLGVLLIALGVVATEYPWALGLGLLVALAAAVWWGVTEWKSGRKSIALRTVAKGVENTPAQISDVVKDAIKKAADSRTYGAVKAEVAAAKKHEGLK